MKTEFFIIFGIILLIFYLYFYVFMKPAVNTQISEYIAKLNEKRKESGAQIPKIIIQIVAKPMSINKLPQNIQKYMDGLKSDNPDFEHKLFTDADIEYFLKINYPLYYNTYNRIPLPIQRFDFFRYIAIYHYGGFYFDADVESSRPIDASLLQHDSIFPVDEYISPDLAESHPERYGVFYQGQFPILLGQYAFAAIPHHPFIKKLIDTIHDNVREYVKRKTDDHLYVYKTTGPDFVTICFMDYQGEDVYILDNGERQVFGDYAKHRYLGSWK